MLFDDLSSTKNQLIDTNNELSTTKNDLSATKNQLIATNNELSTTKNELSATKNELSATRDDLLSTKTKLRETNVKLDKATNEIVELRKIVSTRSPTHQSTSLATKLQVQTTPSPPSRMLSPLPATKPRSKPTATPVEEIIPLMEKVVRPNQPRATQSSYCNNVKHMSELMKIGQLYFMNEEECFFKIRLQKNHQYLRISLEKDIARRRNHENNVFENEDIVFWDWSSCYYLYVSIRKHDEKNSKGFLIDTKRTGNNRLLKYDGNIGWNEYKDFNDCLLFYFTKK